MNSGGNTSEEEGINSASYLSLSNSSAFSNIILCNSSNASSENQANIYKCSLTLCSANNPDELSDINSHPTILYNIVNLETVNSEIITGKLEKYTLPTHPLPNPIPHLYLPSPQQPKLEYKKKEFQAPNSTQYYSQSQLSLSFNTLTICSLQNCIQTIISENQVGFKITTLPMSAGTKCSGVKDPLIAKPWVLCVSLVEKKNNPFTPEELATFFRFPLVEENRIGYSYFIQLRTSTHPSLSVKMSLEGSDRSHTASVQINENQFNSLISLYDLRKAFPLLDTFGSLQMNHERFKLEEDIQTTAHIIHTPIALYQVTINGSNPSLSSGAPVKEPMAGHTTFETTLNEKAWKRLQHLGAIPRNEKDDTTDQGAPMLDMVQKTGMEELTIVVPEEEPKQPKVIPDQKEPLTYLGPIVLVKSSGMNKESRWGSKEYLWATAVVCLGLLVFLFLGLRMAKRALRTRDKELKKQNLVEENVLEQPLSASPV